MIAAFPIFRHPKLVPTISLAHNIERLYLWADGIDSIPEEIGNLKKIKLLMLSDNNIRTLPVTICKIKRLKRLYIDDTKITDLPDQLSSLHHLRFLSIAFTKVSSIPTTMHKIRHLSLAVTGDNCGSEITGFSYADMVNLLNHKPKNWTIRVRLN